MMENDAYRPYITWNTEGDQVTIHDFLEFEKYVLPIVCKFNSFVRKLQVGHFTFLPHIRIQLKSVFFFSSMDLLEYSM